MIRYAGPSDWLTCCKSHETGRARVEKEAECKVQATDPEDSLGASRPQSYFDFPSSQAGRELQEKHVCENHQAALPQQHLGKALAKPCCMCMAHGRRFFSAHDATPREDDVLWIESRYAVKSYPLTRERCWMRGCSVRNWLAQETLSR